MAYPPAYVRAYSFTDYETNNPGQPKPGDKLDSEYDAVANALTATQTNLAIIQRADGELANESVGVDQLQAGLFDAIGDAAVADAEAAAAAAASSATLALSYATSAAASDAAAATSAATASGAAGQAGASQSIAQDAAVQAAASADAAEDAADVAIQAANDTAGSVAAGEAQVQRAFEWAELLTGPVLPAPPGWPEAVDDGMFSSKWWAIRARDYMTVTHLDLGSGQTDIGQAFADWLAVPNDMPLGLIYATWGAPPLEYALTDPTDPTNPASWTLISGGPGPPGPANTLTVGVVNTGAPGSAALVSITGTAPNQVLNMQIPAGATGGIGPIGPAGPPNALAIGTVTTVPDGSPAGATITGTAPTQTLNLTIPAGPQGIQGIQGPIGPPGTPTFAAPTALLGLAAIAGVATTSMRSDAAPALNQNIAPVWTGIHTFTAPVTRFDTANPSIRLTSTTAAADKKRWDFVAYAADGAFAGRHLNDAESGATEWLRVLPSGINTGLTNISFGDASNPSYNFLGTGVVTTGGVIRGPDGSAAAPTYSWTSASTTGLYFNAGNSEVRHSYAGVDVAGWNTTALYSYVPIRVMDGSAGAPPFSFRNDPDSGVFRVSAGVIGVSLDGNNPVTFGGTASFTTGAITARGGAGTVYAGIFQGSGTSASPGVNNSCLRLTSAGAGQAVDLIFTDNAANYVSWISSASNGDLVFSVTGLSLFGEKMRITAGGVTGVSFTTTSSRAIKRETGAPTMVGNILARLRPLLYRLLDGDDREQLGLIAEEVHEVCPQLSDGKTVAYDRLAILLLAAWQEERLAA